MKWHCKLVHGWMVYTELAPKRQQFHVAQSYAATKERYQYTTSVDIKNTRYKKKKKKKKKGYTHSQSHTTCAQWVTSRAEKSAIQKGEQNMPRHKGAGIAQWLEHRTRDWKVTGSNPCWNGGRIFFSRVDFLCWLLFRYPFHPRVTTVARKKSRSFCQKCRCQVTAKHAYTLRMWILLNRASALVTTCP